MVDAVHQLIQENWNQNVLPDECNMVTICTGQMKRLSDISTTGTIYTKYVQILADTEDMDIISRSEPGVKEAYRALKKKLDL